VTQVSRPQLPLSRERKRMGGENESRRRPVNDPVQKLKASFNTGKRWKSFANGEGNGEPPYFRNSPPHAKSTEKRSKRQVLRTKKRNSKSVRPEGIGS